MTPEQMAEAFIRIVGKEGGKTIVSVGGYWFYRWASGVEAVEDAKVESVVQAAKNILALMISREIKTQRETAAAETMVEMGQTAYRMGVPLDAQAELRLMVEIEECLVADASEIGDKEYLRAVTNMSNMLRQQLEAYRKLVGAMAAENAWAEVYQLGLEAGRKEGQS